MENVGSAFRAANDLMRLHVYELQSRPSTDTPELNKGTVERLGGVDFAARFSVALLGTELSVILVSLVI